MELSTNFARLPISATLLFTDIKLTNKEARVTKFARVAGAGGWGSGGEEREGEEGKSWGTTTTNSASTLL